MSFPHPHRLRSIAVAVESGWVITFLGVSERVVVALVIARSLSACVHARQFVRNECARNVGRATLFISAVGMARSSAASNALDDETRSARLLRRHETHRATTHYTTTMCTQSRNAHNTRQNMRMRVKFRTFFTGTMTAHFLILSRRRPPPKGKKRPTKV